MPQTNDLLHTLKKLLKRHNKTYVDVAACLQLSEASVKRLFSEQNMSLQRLDLWFARHGNFRVSTGNAR